MGDRGGGLLRNDGLSCGKKCPGGVVVSNGGLLGGGTYG